MKTQKKQKKSNPPKSPEPKKFPYVFDLYWDIKDHHRALGELKRWRHEYVRLAKDYKEMHRLLREHGYKCGDLPPEIT